MKSKNEKRKKRFKSLLPRRVARTRPKKMKSVLYAPARALLQTPSLERRWLKPGGGSVSPPPVDRSESEDALSSSESAYRCRDRKDALRFGGFCRTLGVEIFWDGGGVFRRVFSGLRSPRVQTISQPLHRLRCALRCHGSGARKAGTTKEGKLKLCAVTAGMPKAGSGAGKMETEETGKVKLCAASAGKSKVDGTFFDRRVWMIGWLDCSLNSLVGGVEDEATELRNFGGRRSGLFFLVGDDTEPTPAAFFVWLGRTKMGLRAFWSFAMVSECFSQADFCVVQGSQLACNGADGNLPPTCQKDTEIFGSLNICSLTSSDLYLLGKFELENRKHLFWQIKIWFFGARHSLFWVNQLSIDYAEFFADSSGESYPHSE